MLVKCQILAEGPGPSERVVSIKTIDGHNEQVLLSKRSITDGYIRVGAALSSEKDRVLVELPRESTAGRWRVWVPRSEVKDEQYVEAAE